MRLVSYRHRDEFFGDDRLRMTSKRITKMCDTVDVSYTVYMYLDIYLEKNLSFILFVALQQAFTFHKDALFYVKL